MPLAESRDGSVLSDEEFAGPGSDVAGFGQDRFGGRVEALHLFSGQKRSGSFLNQFLMTALKRTVSGRDHHDVAVGVGKALSFDMPWLVQIALDETFTAAERCDRLAGRRVEEFGDLAQLPGDLETATTAAKSGLDRNR